MTAAEFASKYTVLKPLDQRSVRSFVAQELSTRRAIMVHWLDQLSPADRAALLTRLERLPPEARERLLGIETVDGAPVVVTRMILDFESLTKWLDRVAPAGFTDLFMARGTPAAEIDSPTVAWTPPSVPKAEPKSEPKSHPPISVRFREPGSVPKPEPPKAAPPAPAAPAPGEFTRIFGAPRVDPEPPLPMRSAPEPPPPQFMPSLAPPTGGAASATSALARVSAPPPPPSPASPPPLTPSAASSPWSGPPPVEPLPPQRTPMPGANINLSPSAPVMPAQPVQSDFTRIIGAAHATPVPPVPVVPAAPPAPPAGSRSMLPVLIALGALALSAIILVVYFVIHR